ncbi:hypothetical protein T4D_14095 [Trichinella pseudospiralis]|uniref:Uncharacterized protein n=1 Tax=Trichinella pseudospiralis TaxID=6337 RepID=A0A0V1F2L5_TRIPS|nr:hypothetical protein T4D_14095 [Trichinella pseudospiralis]
MKTPILGGNSDILAFFNVRELRLYSSRCSSSSREDTSKTLFTSHRTLTFIHLAANTRCAKWSTRASPVNENCAVEQCDFAITSSEKVVLSVASFT